MSGPISEKVLKAIRDYRDTGVYAQPCRVRWAPDVEKDVLAELIAENPRLLTQSRKYGIGTIKAKDVTFQVEIRMKPGTFVVDAPWTEPADAED